MIFTARPWKLNTLLMLPNVRSNTYLWSQESFPYNIQTILKISQVYGQLLRVQIIESPRRVGLRVGGHLGTEWLVHAQCQTTKWSGSHGIQYIGVVSPSVVTKGYWSTTLVDYGVGFNQ